MPFQLPLLSFSYDAFEPYIDAQTMELHHKKHHQTYIDQLNAIVEKNTFLQNQSLDALLSLSHAYEDSVRSVVRNHGGGHFNHTFFWQQMSPHGMRQPVGIVAQKLYEQFGSFDSFKLEFEGKAKSVFGSGWAWLVVDNQNKFHIITTPNQDAPLLYGYQPVMGLDVWEHAYYLKYQNRRADYIAAWWHVVDWEKIEHMFNSSDISFNQNAKNNIKI